MEKKQREKDCIYQIKTDLRLWHILFPKSNDFVKNDKPLQLIEAFYFLMKKQRVNLSIYGEYFFTTSIVNLADAWNWSRYKTKKYLLELEKIGAVEIQFIGKQILIKLNNVIYDNDVKK